MAAARLQDLLQVETSRRRPRRRLLVLMVLVLLMLILCVLRSEAVCLIDGQWRQVSDEAPGIEAELCGSTDWRTVYLDSFEAVDGVASRWSDGSRLVCGRFGPVLDLEAPPGEAAVTSRVFALEELHATVLITLDLLAPYGWGEDGAPELTLTAGDPGVPGTIVWSSLELASVPWSPSYSSLSTACAAAARGTVSRVAATVSHTGTSLELRVVLQLPGRTNAGGFSVGLDNVRLALPAVATIGEVGEVVSAAGVPGTVRLRGNYVQTPVVLVGVPPVSLAGVATRVVVLQQNDTAHSGEATTCELLSGAAAQRFKACGGACVALQSCWDDAAGCEALRPEGRFETCGGRCVPRGGCGWSFEVSLQTCGGDAADESTPLPWLALEPGVHWSATDSLFAMEVGSVDVNTVAFTRVVFDGAFESAAATGRAPVVLSSLQTLSSDQMFLSARHAHTNMSGFSAVMQRADRLELRLDGTVKNGLPRQDETLGWLAATARSDISLGGATFEATVVPLSSSSAEVQFRSAFEKVAVFASVMELRGLDSVNVKQDAVASSSSVVLRLDEDTCQDAETEHAMEAVGVILVGYHPSALSVLLSNLTHHLRSRKDQGPSVSAWSCVCSDQEDALAASGIYDTCEAARASMAEQGLDCTEVVRFLEPTVALSDVCPVTCGLCDPDTNVALSKPVLSDSSTGGLTADKALDGCISGESRWVSSSEEAQHWMTIDLLDTYLLRAVVVHEDVGEALGSCKLEVDIFEANAASWQTVGTAPATVADAGTDPCAALSTIGQLQPCEGICVPRHSCWDLNAARGARSVTFANINLEAFRVRVRVDTSECMHIADRHARIHDVSVFTACPAGYIDAGTTECVQVNPCREAILAQSEPCDTNSQCSHTGPGQFVCTCKDGWKRKRFVAGTDSLDPDTKPDGCALLSGAAAQRFKACGGACVALQSCWDDAAGCEALGPEGRFETCGGRCVPRGGCGWSYVDPCVDVAPPTLECSPAISAVTALGSAFVTVTVPLPTVYDDSSFNLDFSHVNGTLSSHSDVMTPVEVSLSIGTNVVGWRATDSYGNHATCYIDVTVLDFEAPRIGLCGVAVSVTAPRGRLEAMLDFSAYGEGIQLTDNSLGTVTLEAWTEPSFVDTECAMLGSTSFITCYGSCVPAADCQRAEPIFSTTAMSVGNHSLVIQAVDASGNRGDLCSIDASVLDFDECQDPATRNGGCWGGLVCTNLPGRMMCSECPSGLFGNRWPSQCHLQDPCNETLAAMWPTESVSLHQCDRFAICAHEETGLATFGTYTCTCRPGFVGSGFADDCTDVEPPTVFCVANLTLLTAPGQAIASVDLEPFPHVTDNSGAAMTTKIKVNQSGEVTDRLAGAHVDFILDAPSHIIYTARDVAGNEGKCVTDVIVDDAEPPTMNCRNTTALAIPWRQYADVMVEPVEVTDNSGVAVSLVVLLPQYITVEQNVSSNENISAISNASTSRIYMGTDHQAFTLRLQSGAAHLFTWIASTGDGLLSHCTTQVYVQDANECTAVSTSANGGCSQLRECIDTVGGRHCASCPVGWVNHENKSDTECVSVNPCLPSNNPCDLAASCSHIGPGVHLCVCHVGYTGNGSAGFCSDISPPLITCADDWNIQTDQGNSTAARELPYVTAYDSADGHLPVAWNFTGNSTHLENTTVEANLHMGTTVVEYAAIDTAGNRATCVWSVQVVDTEAPVLANCMDVSIVAPPFQHIGHPFLSPGLHVEVWSPEQLPEPPIEVESLGDPMISTVWGNVNQSATLTAFPGFQTRRDRFVAIWSGYIDISGDGAGEYVFCVNASDGDHASLFVDRAIASDGAPAVLTGPMVELELQFVEFVGLAKIVLQWQRPGHSEFEVVPARVLHHTVLRGWPTLVEDNSQLGITLHVEDDSGAIVGIPSAFDFGFRMLRIVATDHARNRASCLINVTVEDRDECATDNGGCDDLAVCINQIGSRLCSLCPLGFEGNGYDGCTIIDQCHNTTGVMHTCTAVAACHLGSPGEYSCLCPEGYEGNGFEITSDKTGTGCTDIADPILVCPSVIVVDAWPDASTAFVALNLQEVRDNSGVSPVVSASQVYDGIATSIDIGDPQEFPVGVSTVHVIAQDAEQNTAACTVEVEIQPIVSVTVPTRMHYLFEGRQSSVVVYSYHLGSPPKDNTTVVTVLARPAGAAQAFLHLDSPQATFTALNWSATATMRVQVTDDCIDQGDAYFAEIYHTTSSSDIMHDNLTSPPVHITVLDDDVASVVTEESVVVSELGSTKSFSFSLVLGSQPTANVAIVPQVDTSDVLLVNTSIVFNQFDWNVAQAVHGIVYNDDIDEGDVETKSIFHTVSSADSMYDNITVAQVKVYIRDNDVSPLPEGFHIAGVSVGPTTGNTRLILVPHFREPNATHKAFLFGEFASQFDINARVFDVARQRRVLSRGCTWTRASSDNETTPAYASCLTPAVPFPGNAFSYEVQVRWSNRGFTPWLHALESFEYHLPVIVSHSFPSGSPTFGGSHVQLQATNFMTIAGVTPACVFRSPLDAEDGDIGVADVYVPAETISSGLLACTTPALRAGVGQLRVTVNGQQPSASYVPFTYYNNNCSATRLSIASGPTTGGTVIIIDGSEFVNTDVLCTFVVLHTSGGAQANLSTRLSVVGTYINESQLLCTSPPVQMEAAGSFALTLSLNGGQDQCTGETGRFDYYREPYIEVVDPPMISVARCCDNTTASPTSIHITGAGFNQTGMLWSRCGAAVATMCTITNDSSAVCFAPASHAGGRVEIQLSLNGVDWSNASHAKSRTSTYLTYVPVVTSHEPSLGPRSGGTQIFVYGYGFQPAGPHGSPWCAFGQQHIIAQYVNSTHLVCTSPAGVHAGPHGVHVGVSVGGEYFNFAPSEFWMHEEPIVQELSTVSAPFTGRLLITVFLNHIELPVGTSVLVRILPDGTRVRPECILDATWAGQNVVFDLPDFTQPSYHDFSNDLPGDVRLSLSFNAVDWSKDSLNNRNRLNIFDTSSDPVIHEVRPASGPFAGGTQLSVRGSNFANLPSLRCVFHKWTASNDTIFSGWPRETFAVWISASEARCTTPRIPLTVEHHVVQVNVSATNLGTPTNSTSTAWFRFTATDPASSYASGSGLGLNDVDLVVAGETASFTIHAVNSEGNARPVGGDVFYATLAAVNAEATVPRHARTFDLDEDFITVDVARERSAVLLAQTALQLRVDADAVAHDASVALESYREELLLLGSNNWSPIQRAVEWARVQQLLEHAEELAYNASSARLIATEAQNRADVAAEVVSSLMLPDPDSVVEPVTLAQYSYNDYYCTMYKPLSRRVTECCQDAPSVCTRLPGLAGTHLGLYSATVAGVHELTVLLAGNPIAGSPWYVTVSPAMLSPSRTILSGLRNGTATGDRLNLELAPRDRFGNDRIEPLDGAFHVGMGATVGVTFSLQTKTNARQINWRLEDVSGTVFAEQGTDTYEEDTAYEQNVELPSRAYRFYAMATSGHGWYNAKLLVIQKSTGLPLIGPIILGDFGPRKLLTFSIGVRASLGLYLCTTLLNPAPDRCLGPDLRQDPGSSVSVQKPDSQGVIPVWIVSRVSGTFLLRASVNDESIDSDRTRIVFVPGPTQANVSTFFGLDQEFIAGERGQLVMQAYDQYGNFRGVGGDVWDANPSLEHDRASNVVHLHDNGDSTYDVAFSVTIAGLWRPQIRLAGNLVGSGPLYLRVLPADIDVGACMLVGNSARHVVAGENTKLTVQGRDRFGNNRTTNDCTMGISIHRGATLSQRSCTDWGSRGFNRVAGLCATEAQCSRLSCPTVEAYIHSCNSSFLLDGVPVLMTTICPATCGVCSTVVRALATEYDDEAQGQYISFFNETLAHMPLQLTIAIGAASNVVKPAPIKVLPAATDVSSSLTWGTGLRDSAAGDTVRVHIRLRDRFRNDRAVGGELGLISFAYHRVRHLSTTWEHRPDIVPEKFEVRDNDDDGTYTISYLFVPVSNYTLYIEHNHLPFPVSPVTVKKFARPAPALTAVAFDSSLARIRATFDYPTNMFGADNGSCASLLDPALLMRVGGTALCSWSSASTLVVSLPSRVQVEPDTVLFQISDCPLQSYMENSQPVNSSRLIGAPSSPVTPRVILTGPVRVGPCDSALLSAALSYGGGSSGLTFHWQALRHMFQFVPGNNQMLASIVSSQTTSILVLGPDVLLADREYTFRVTVRNFLGHSSQADWTLRKVADTVLPLHLVHPHIETTADKDTLLMAVVHQPVQCDTTAVPWGKRQVKFRWNLVNGSDTPGIDIHAQRSSSLALPGSAMHTFDTYVFELFTYLDGLPTINNTVHASVIVAPGEIDIWIDGGDRAVCDTDTATVLEAVTSDPSELRGNFTYAWDCVALSPIDEHIACPDTMTTFNGSYVELKDLLAGVYTISVVLTQESVDRSGLVLTRTAMATTVLTVRAQSCSHLRILRSQRPWLHSQRLVLRGLVDSGAVAWQWYTDRFELMDLRHSDTTVTGTSQANLVVRESKLQPGTRYKFFLLAGVVQNETNYAEAVIQTAEAPCCGSLAVTPQVGEALSSTFALQTTVAQHSAWSTNVESMPLQYQFSYSKGGRRYSLSELQLVQSLETFLPVGDSDRDFLIELSVSVSDVYLSRATSRTLVTAHPVDESRISAALNHSLVMVEDSLRTGSSQSVGLIISLCDFLNFISRDATNSSRRALAEGTGSAERTAVRERLAQAVVGVAYQTEEAIPSMLAVAAVLSAAPCELSQRSIDLLTPWLASVISNADGASVEAVLQGADALDNLLQTGNCLPEQHVIQPGANSSTLCNCHGRGLCVDGACRCESHMCVPARCTLSREPRAPGCFQPNPLCHATDASAVCNKLTCEVGLCAPGNTTCVEGRCVPGGDGLDCFLGPCPEAPMIWALPDCLYTEDGKHKLNLLEERHSICRASDLQSSVQALTRLAATQRVAEEPDLDVALESFQLKVATLSLQHVSGYIMAPPTLPTADVASPIVILPEACQAASVAPNGADVAVVVWSMCPYPFGRAGSDQNSSYLISRVVSLALSPCIPSDRSSPFVVLLPRTDVPPDQSMVVMSSSCPTCSQHGRCENGTCHCNNGYTGANCSSQVVPEDSPIRTIEECRYWNASRNVWDDAGCSVVLKNVTHIVCECVFHPRLVAAFMTEWSPLDQDLNPFSEVYLSGLPADPLSLPVFCIVCGVTLVYLVAVRISFQVNRKSVHQQSMQRVIRQRVAAKNGSGITLATRKVGVRSASVVPVYTGREAKYLPGGAQLEIMARSSVGVRGRVAALLHPQWLCNELHDLGFGRTRSCIWIDVWRGRDIGPITRVQRLTVLLVVVLSNIALSVALFGVSRCKPRHRNECSQAVNGCACTPEPEDISWSRIVLTAVIVSVLVLPCDRVLLGIWELVELRTRSGTLQGPGNRPWSVHDFATQHRSIILVQTAVRAFLARNRVILARKIQLSQLNSHHEAMVAVAASAPPPPPILSRRAALEANNDTQSGSRASQIWVRRRPFNSTIIDSQQTAFAALVGAGGRTAEEVVRGAVMIQRWFRRAARRRHRYWQDRIVASRRCAPTPTSELGIPNARWSAGSTETRQSSELQAQGSNGDAPHLARSQLLCTSAAPRRWRRRQPLTTEIESEGRSPATSKQLPPWFSWLMYCTSLLWSAGCGVYAIVAAAYYNDELTRAWALCLCVALAMQTFVWGPLWIVLRSCWSY